MSAQPDPATDPRYRPMPKGAYRALAFARALPLIGFLVFMWFAAFHNSAVPFSVGATAFVALSTVYLWMRVRRGQSSARLAAGQLRTTALLAEGRIEEAAAATDGTLDRARGVPPVHCILLVQRAQLFLRLGDADRARTVLEAVHASKWLDDPRLSQGASSLASARAMTELVRGDLDAAEEWQKAAHAKIKAADRTQLLPLDALVEVRRGRFEEAARRIDEAWDAAEASLAPRAFDLVRMVRAFAADALGEPKRDAGDADVAYLTPAWPELRAFAAKRAAS